MLDWNGREIEVATSAGGVLAAANPWDALVRAGIEPWPPPELIQKLYQSRQARAFRGVELETAVRRMGFYSDLQSLRSEDAITWSVFGPLVYAAPEVRRRFTGALLRRLGLEAPDPAAATIWLWRRLPHPDTLVPGGPEIDFGIQTADVLLLGEAKWLSGIGAAQGVWRDKDQITLRHEFCERYGGMLLPNCRHFIVLGVSPEGGMVAHRDISVGQTTLHLRDSTWESICSMPEHPLSDELLRYVAWKRECSGMNSSAPVHSFADATHLSPAPDGTSL